MKIGVFYKIPAYIELEIKISEESNKEEILKKAKEMINSIDLSMLSAQGSLDEPPSIDMLCDSNSGHDVLYSK